MHINCRLPFYTNLQANFVKRNQLFMRIFPEKVNKEIKFRFIFRALSNISDRASL